MTVWYHMNCSNVFWDPEDIVHVWVQGQSSKTSSDDQGPVSQARGAVDAVVSSPGFLFAAYCPLSLEETLSLARTRANPTTECGHWGGEEDEHDGASPAPAEG